MLLTFKCILKYVRSLLDGVVLCVLSSVAIILLRKNELVMMCAAVCVLFLFLMISLVGQ